MGMTNHRSHAHGRGFFHGFIWKVARFPRAVGLSYCGDEFAPEASKYER